MGNVGKDFEAAIRKSVPEWCLYYKLPDQAAAFGQTSGLRFSKKNPFDAILFNPRTRTLYAVELKTVAGKSISFERTKDETGVIHKHQIDGLLEWSKYDGVVAGFIIEFRQEETTVFLDIKTFTELSSSVDKKSFNLSDLDAHALQYTVIEQQKLRTRYRYDIEKFLSEYPG